MADDFLTITGLRASAHHGVFDHERENGQDFVLDVTVWLDTRAAAASDDLSQTVHYGELAEQLVSAIERDPVDLIETVAERLATLVLEKPGADRVRITLHKPSAPIGVPFDDVSITITRARS
jgi:dihydroneopterin aldolase